MDAFDSCGCALAKPHAALLFHWFYQSSTIAIVFLLACPKRRLNVHTTLPLWPPSYLHPFWPSQIGILISPWCSQTQGFQDKAIRPASLKVCRSLPLECFAWRHQGKGLYTVFQSFSKDSFLQYPSPSSDCDGGCGDSIVMLLMVYVRARVCAYMCVRFP